MTFRLSFGASLALALASTPLSAANLFTAEHGDVFAVGYEGGELEPHVHIEGGFVNGVFVDDDEYEPDDIVTVVPQSSFDYISGVGGRPAGSEWDPIGVASGAGFYFLPQVDGGPGGADALGAPFAGIGTEELDAGDWSTPISIQLVSVSGPGNFSFWQDGFSPAFFMSSADGIDGSDVYTQPAGGHDHANWGFSELGSYDITVRVSGTHAVDGPKSADATYSFAVVPEPSVGLFALLGGSLLVFRRRRGARG
ncbi:MAG: choice-of-anchor M domain-containing protein [Verrucomicrobiales bacterium]